LTKHEKYDIIELYIVKKGKKRRDEFNSL